MPTTNDQRVKDLGEEFAQAQQRGDPAALDSLLADEFKLVGPLGFLLDKQQWLAQYRAGALVNHSVQWDEVDVRVLGQVAIAIGRQTQRASYQGQPADGTFRRPPGTYTAAGDADRDRARRRLAAGRLALQPDRPTTRSMS